MPMRSGPTATGRRGTTRKESEMAKARAARTGKSKAVKKGFTKIRPSGTTVVRVDAVTGPFDFIAMVEGASLDAIGRLVTDVIGTIDGVTRTTTCVAMTIA